MSPDYNEGPDTVPYALWSDPQTINLYSYVRNKERDTESGGVHTLTIFGFSIFG